MPRVRTIAINDSQVKLNILTSDNATYQDDYSQWQASQSEYTHKWQCHIPGRLQTTTTKSNRIYSPVSRPYARTITINDSQVKLNILTSGNATHQDDYSQWQPSQIEYTHQCQCHIQGRLQSVAAKSIWVYSRVARPHARTITADDSDMVNVGVQNQTDAVPTVDLSVTNTTL